MLHNYLKSAFRFLKQNRLFAGINAMGLAIALAASFIILLFVINELSCDHFNKNRKRIYRVLNYYADFNATMSGTPYILASALKAEFPQVEKAANTKHVRDFKLKLKNDFIDIPDAVGTDSNLFSIFTLPIILGPANHNLLDDKSSLLLSGSLTEKLFPGQNPVGKEIEGLVNNEEHIFMVRGVFKDIPANSSLTAQCFISSKWTIDPVNKVFGIDYADKSWTHDFWITWVMLSKSSYYKAVEQQFPAFEIKNISEKPHNHYSLQNLSEVYLGSQNVANSGISGSMSNVKLFSAIAFLILLVASVNYIILSTAVSSARSKEIGLRKTYGAGNINVRYQLLSESVLLSVIVLPVSLLLMWLALPSAGRLFQTNLHIIGSNIIIYAFVYLLLTILIGLASGIYTSSYLSRLKVLDILKNTPSSGKKKLLFRSALIVLQLVIFCSFVSATFIIRSQYNYALKKNPGYYNHDIVLIDLGRDFNGYASYINSIKSIPDVIEAAGVMEGLPMQGSMSSMYPNFQNKDVKVQIEGLDCDYDFLKTMGIGIKEGRDFSREFGSDLTKSAILNETAVHRLGITDPIEKMIGEHTIIGVVKDFNLHSVHSDIPPLEINMTDKYIDQVAVHYKPGTLKNILPVLESEWKKAAPDRPFRYSTIEDLILNLYSSEKNLTVIVSIFALFTLLIAAFGLFGLTLFVARSRTREIGIKKVFGSSEGAIILSFLKGNLILVLMAAVISIPVTLHFMITWLNNFAFKISISFWVFGIAFLTAAIVVLLTVFLQSYKASMINPVDALHYE